VEAELRPFATILMKNIDLAVLVVEETGESLFKAKPLNGHIYCGLRPKQPFLASVSNRKRKIQKTYERTHDVVENKGRQFWKPRCY